jgi:NADH-quinone oxidoreductase subunit J
MRWLLLAQETATAEATAAAGEVTEASGFEFGQLLEFAASVNGRLILAVLLGTFGIWMMLPGPRKSSRVLGSLLALAAAICMLSLAPLLEGTIQIPFSMLAGITLVAAVSAVTSRNPVYAAIWFALLLLGVGGLFLINGAQFLGIATVAVYAGAIVVTFLFVLMLAQPEGHAFYDRVGWGKISQFIGCLTGMVLAAAIVWAVLEPGAIVESVSRGERAVDHPQHVASLGGQLFTRHLAAVQAAGALLLAALVGAVAMASHGTGARGLDERMSLPAEDSTAPAAQGADA